MIVLDTNVLSALMRPDPDNATRIWLDRQIAADVYTTAITILEIRTGIEILPESRRRRSLEVSFVAAMAEIENRILAFDAVAARAAASLVARRERLGRPIEYRDMQIAGIVLAQGARLATFNTRHFNDLGIDLADPSAE